MGFRRRQLNKRKEFDDDSLFFEDQPDWEGGRANERKKGLKLRKKKGFDAWVCCFVYFFLLGVLFCLFFFIFCVFDLSFFLHENTQAPTLAVGMFALASVLLVLHSMRVI